jgi:non-ribosomal peptide synthetase component F
MPAVRILTAVFVLTIAAFAQIDATSYGALVATRVNEGLALAKLVEDASDDLATAHRKLERRVSDDGRQSPQWQEVKETYVTSDKNLLALARVLRAQATADRKFLDQIAPGAIARRSIVDNLAASARFHQAVADALSSLSQLLDKQRVALQALPDSVKDEPEFTYARRVRGASAEAFDDAAQAARRRRTEYDKLARSLAP